MKRQIFSKNCVAVLLLSVLFLTPVGALAVSDNTQQGQGNSSSTTSETTEVETTSSTQNQNENQNRVQTQTNNPETDEMTQTQTEEQLRVDAEVKESQPQYSPANSKSNEHKSIVANAAEELVQLANKTENQGVGDKIKTIAQTQSQNQDKIGQSIDKAETRTAFAKFFIGANYKELKTAKNAMIQNQNQIKELEEVMSQVANESDQLAIANQIILLQSTQLELKDQINDLGSGFSLFGWLSRWINKF